MVRPRTTSFPPEEMIALGEEMVEWLKVNSEPKNILHLSEWYTIEKGFTYNEWKKFIEKEEFRPYYDQALKIIGKKYLDKESRVREGASQRWQRVYFKDLREEEDETKKYLSELQKDEDKTKETNLHELRTKLSSDKLSQK